MEAAAQATAQGRGRSRAASQQSPGSVGQGWVEMGWKAEDVD